MDVSSTVVVFGAAEHTPEIHFTVPVDTYGWEFLYTLTPPAKNVKSHRLGVPFPPTRRMEPSHAFQTWQHGEWPDEETEQRLLDGELLTVIEAGADG